ncbi:MULTISPECIES: GntR family transcriptional regulator [unclassified Microbacterium]|uniref:GntR family transcriptional regulator n=1 Tax=unclassified Microbacterium TaxID=2609290 RepID=UPI001E634887|nr:GntR family transcriptional regulator [Microbacterium sp. Au-Mic1]MCE4026747.1 GntR family transcriptional regulator [Microbacterium sp. Au-Mic1]
MPEAAPHLDEEIDVDHDTALDALAYEWIRDRIIDGTMKHGSRVRERDIAAQLGVSRNPIREALPRLEAEGYIRTLHRRGAVVTPMRVREIIELFSVRAVLEPLSAREAAQRCAEGASAEPLLACLAAAEEAMSSGDAHRIADATAAFHDVIVELSGNVLLQQISLPISGRVRRYFNIITQEGDANTHDEHRLLCEAIAGGHVEWAGSLAAAHLEHGRVSSMKIVDQLFEP